MKNQMIGYEINPVVGLETKKGLSKHKNVKIISENIFDSFPDDVNIFFLHDPFKGPMMEEFKERIWEIRHNEPIILYLHPVQLHSFDDDRFSYEKVEVTYLNWTYNLAIIKIAG